jgi:hypothetical protein
MPSFSPAGERKQYQFNQIPNKKFPFNQTPQAKNKPGHFYPGLLNAKII